MSRTRAPSRKPAAAADRARPAGDVVAAAGWARAAQRIPNPREAEQASVLAEIGRSPRVLGQRRQLGPLFGPAVAQRVALGGVDYLRQSGGELVDSEEQAFGDVQQPAPAAQASELAFVANVPTSGGAVAVAARYAQGWGQPQEMRRRQRLVVGVNTYQSLAETAAQAMTRARETVGAGFPADAIGKALVFVWRARWNLPWPAAPVMLNEAERAAERAAVLDRTHMPYGLFRSTVLASPATAEYAEQYRALGYEPYVHVGDPDAPSFRVPQGRQHPGGNKVFLAGPFANESQVGLFDRLGELIDRRRQVRDGHAAKPFPTVLAGGYQIRSSSAPGVAIPLSEVANQIDMQVRRVLFSGGSSPAAAYLPEPNLLVRWHDLPREPVGAIRAATNLFGNTNDESRVLMGNLIAALQAQHLTLEQIRARVAFKPAAAVATGATGQGERFRARTEQPVLRPADARAAAGMTLDAAYQSVLRSGQSHASPEQWAQKAVKAAEAPTLDGATTRRARHHLRAPGADAGTAAARAAISALATGPVRADRPPALSPEADARLRDLARATVAVVGSYEPTLQQLIAPAPGE